MNRSPSPGFQLAVFAISGGILAVALLHHLQALTRIPLQARLEGLFIDTCYQARLRAGPHPPVDPRLAAMRIDPASIERFGRWPWRRGLHAELLAKAAPALNPRGLVYDILFRAASDPAEDAALEAGLGSGIPIGLALQVSAPSSEGATQALKDGPDFQALADHLLPGPVPAPLVPRRARAVVPPLARFTRKVRHLGHILSSPDADGVYRRFHPFVEIDGRRAPSLALVGACLLLKLPLASARIEGRELVLGPGGELPREHRFPLDDRGAMLINWVGRFGTRIPSFSAMDLDLPPTPKLLEKARDRLWVVGVSGLEVDQGPTPVDWRDIPLSDTHLHAINTLVTGAAVRPEAGPLWFLGTLGLFALIPLAATRLGALPAALAGLAVLAAYPAAGVGLFLASTALVPGTWPMVFGLGAYLGTLAHIVFVQERARQRTRDAFARYFSDRVVKKILAEPEGPRLGGRKAELTILFADIKGFTTASEKLDPDLLAEFLGVYFDTMVEIVFRYEGTVDKFLGDGLMCFWGDPVPQPDHARRALAAAREMQQAAQRLSTEWSARLGGPFLIRIGLNTGTVTVGNMGGRRRMEYTVLGAAVNLAQRLESNATPGKILIGEATRKALPEGEPVGPRTMIKVKGLDEEVAVYPVEP